MWNWNRNRLTFVVAIVALASASCDVEFRHPLTDEKTSTLDERLVGDWSCGAEIWRVTKRPDFENSLELQIVGDAEMPPPPHGIIYATVIGSHHYLSLLDLTEGDDAKTFSIYRYKFSDEGTVTVFGQDLGLFKTAISAKELRGKINTKKSEPTPIGDLVAQLTDAETKAKLVEDEPFPATVTESAERLTRYVAKHGLKCFPDTKYNRLTFKRAKPK
jgi:hypothetical protein